MALLLWSGELLAQDNWDAVLDRYEQICEQCSRMRSRIAAGEAVPDRKVTQLLGELSRLRGELQQASGSMSEAQKARFVSIRDSYSGASPVTKEDVQAESAPQKEPPKEQSRPAPAKVRRPQEPKAEVIAAPRQFSPKLPVLKSLGPVCCTPPVGVGQVLRPCQPLSFEEAPHPALRKSLSASVIPSVSYDGVLCGGLFAGVEYKGWGGYLSARSNFASAEHTYECLSYGTIPAGGKFWGNTASRMSGWSFTAGCIKEISPRLSDYAGAGYGASDLFWQDAYQQWALVKDASAHGLVLDAGAQLQLGRICFLAGISWLAKTPATGPCSPAVNLGVGLSLSR